MMKYKKIISISLLTLLVVFSLNYLAYGNSAEPPSILIIAPNASDDLSIKLELEDGEYEGRVVDKIIEKYYTFYSRDIFNKPSTYNFIVSTENESFEIKLDKPAKNYNNIYTLDLKSQTLTEGKLISRSIMLVTMRVVLTLIIEAFIFRIFGFRDKKSWIVFLLINLVTQGAINIWINGFTPLMSYPVFTLIFGEIFVFIAELIAFLVFCKEHVRTRKVLYVLTANFISLIVGGYIITVLPI